MDEGVRRRLVGAVVLVSLFVVFAPMLLETPEPPGGEKPFAEVPAPPDTPFPGRLIDGSAVAPSALVAEGRVPDATPAPVPFEELPPPDEAAADQEPVVVAPPAPLARPARPAPPSAAPGAPPAPGQPVPGVAAPGAPSAATAGTPGPAAGSRPRPGDVSTSVDAPVPAGTPGAGQVGGRAWAVQLSSFPSAANATALRDALRGRGFRAFVESASAGGTRVTRVYVGPELARSKAVAAQQRLGKDLGLKGEVVPYPPGSYPP